MDDSKIRQKSCAGEKFADEDNGTASSGFRDAVDAVDSTALTTTDSTTTINDLDDCRSHSFMDLPSKDIQVTPRPVKRQQKRDVNSNTALLGHVIPPPSWADHSSASSEATRRRANLWKPVPPPPRLTQHLPLLPGREDKQSPDHSENRSDADRETGSLACNGVSDASTEDIATNKYSDSDATEEKALISASVTSVLHSTKLSYVDVLGRLLNKNVKRYTLELDLSAHSLFASVMRHSLPKPLPVMRKSTSCCELSTVTAAPPVDTKRNRKTVNSLFPVSEKSADTRRPLLQLQFGQKFGVVCRETERGKSFALVNVTSSSRTRRSPSADAEQQPESRDVNDNADDKDEQTQTESAWLSSGRAKPNCEDKSEINIGKNHSSVGCVKNDVIHRPSSSSHRGCQLIFV